MNSLFDQGLAYEQHEVESMHIGRAAYQRFLWDICESEAIYVARKYAKEIRKTALRYALYSEEKGIYPTELVDRLIEVATRLEQNPESGRTLIPPDRRLHYQNHRRRLITEMVSNYIPLPESIVREYPTRIPNGFVERNGRRRYALVPGAPDCPGRLGRSGR